MKEHSRSDAEERARGGRTGDRPRAEERERGRRTGDFPRDKRSARELTCLIWHEVSARTERVGAQLTPRAPGSSTHPQTPTPPPCVPLLKDSGGALPSQCAPIDELLHYTLIIVPVRACRQRGRGYMRHGGVGELGGRGCNILSLCHKNQRESQRKEKVPTCASPSPAAEDNADDAD